MHPNSDEIAKAKSVLADAGYVYAHVRPEAAWCIGVMDELGAWGFAVELSPDERENVKRQMNGLKRAYGIG